MKYLVLFFMLSFIFMFSFSCKKEKPAKGIDKELYDKARELSGFIWYKNSEELLEKSSGSGHDYPFLRTRYNTIASAQLDSNRKVRSNAIFAEGSLIVKELYNTSSSLGRYAILYRQSNHADADDRGWVWGYINEDGTVATSASKKGSSCTGCHLQSDHIDYMLMNKFFP